MTNRLGPYELNTIVTGDARELAEAIPDSSVDLIFTDPVYQNIEDYEWLAQTAARVLKPDSACLAFYGGPSLDEAKAAMKKHLQDTWLLNYVVNAKATKLIGFNIFCWTTHCLWFRKGKGFPHKRIPDTFISNGQADNGFKWNKNEAVIAYWLAAFTHPGDIVADFFTGGGTVPAVAKKLTRNYWACEIDPATAARARMRVLLTQPPLFAMPEPEQIAMDLAA